MESERIRDSIRELMDKKFESFVLKYHEDRINKFLNDFHEHYIELTSNEKMQAIEKERKLVEDYFEESRPYTEIRQSDNMKFIDGIPSIYFDLLEKFTIVMFKNYDCSNIELEQYLSTVIEMMAEYFDLARMPHDMAIIQEAVPKYSEKDTYRKLETIRNTAKKLLELTLCDTIGSPLHDRLAKELNSVMNNPKYYLFQKINLKGNRLNEDFLRPLKEYLIEFGISGHKTTIGNFLINLTKETTSIHTT